MKTVTINNPKQSLNNITVGENVKIFDFVNMYNCQIGDNSKVGAFVEVQAGVVIGKNCKISSHSFLCEGVKIGDGVFVGHSVKFINDIEPSAVNEDGSLKAGDDWTLVETIVEERASIGTGSTIMGGITIGENSLVGAGSVVLCDIPKNSVYAGNPAKFIRNK